MTDVSKSNNLQGESKTFKPAGRGFTRRSFVSVAAIAGVQMAVFGLAGCSPQEGGGTQAAVGFTPGSYTAEGQGKFGPVIVETTFTEDAITSVKVIEHEETEGISDRALKEIPKRIIETQSLGIDTISGATLTCTAIITAATDCAKQAGADTKALTNNYEAPALSTEIVELEADVVIAGAGASGMAAAVASAQNGAEKVIVLEKSCNVGGNALVSGGYLEYVNAPAELRADMTDGLRAELEAELSDPATAFVEANSDYITLLKAEYEEYLASGDTKAFDSLYLQALQEYFLVGEDSVDMYEGMLGFSAGVADLVDWLTENGMTWKPNIGIVGYPWPRWSAPTEGFCGQGYFNLFESVLEKNNYPVDILLNTPITELIQEGDAVTGAIAVAEDGTTYKIKSKNGVILATGGFSGNPDMLREYNEFWPLEANQAIPTTNTYGHDGDGINLALEAGGIAEAMELIMMFPFADVKNGTDETTVGSDVDCLLVNAEGERFIDETLDRYTMTEALMEQPGQITFLISDADTCRIEDDTNYYGRNIDNLLAQEQLYKADTLEELAEAMGADPATFKANVERYNEIAEFGEDPDFGRITFSADSPIVNPPFYASPRTWAAHITEGGIIVDEENGYLVISEEDGYVEGLRVVGELSLYNSGVSSMAQGYAAAMSIFAPEEAPEA